MADTHVVSGLVNKRARIDGEIKMRRYQITRLEMELAHLDAVIKMFRPNYDLSKIATKRAVSRSKAGTARGSGTREALTILRESGEALTTRQIAERIIKKRDEPYCADTVAKIGVNIHASLSRRTDGAVKRDASVYPAKWVMGRP